MLVRSYVFYDQNEIEVHEFELLRMDPGTYEWQKTKNGEVPENAIIGGVTSIETLYFGRCLYNETYTHGVIHQYGETSSYFIHGRQVYPSPYEYLVAVKDGLKERFH